MGKNELDKGENHQPLSGRTGGKMEESKKAMGGKPKKTTNLTKLQEVSCFRKGGGRTGTLWGGGGQGVQPSGRRRDLPTSPSGSH